MSLTVIGLFNGMGCSQIALDQCGVKVDKYYASEVDKYAIQITQKNYPNTIQIGDVTKIKVKKLKSCVILTDELGELHHIKGDILLDGGSPCQGFSFAGKMKGVSTKCKIEITSLEQYLNLKEKGFEFEGQSYLFWEYIRILREIKPKYFFLENVMMQKKWKDMFNEAMGCEPHMVNSALVSAQNRKRNYWTNLPFNGQPKDKGLVINDILEDVRDEKYYMKQDFKLIFLGEIEANKLNHIANVNVNVNGHDCIKRVYAIEGKAPTLNTSTGGNREVKVLMNVNPSGRGQNGNVYSSSNKSPTITTNKGEGNKVLIIPEATKKGYAIIKDGECFDGTQLSSKTRRGRRMKDKSNCLTTSPQYYKYEHPRVAKLIPIECERLQTVPDNYTEISELKEYLLYNNLGTNIKELICNVNIMGVKTRQQHTSMVSYVLNITKDLLDKVQLNLLKSQVIKTRSVNIVIEKLGKRGEVLGGCVIDITKTGLDTMTLYTQIKLELQKAQEVIKNELVIKISTDKYMRILLEEHLKEMRLFIILILLKLITELKIYTYVMDKANILFYIDNLKLLRGNLLSVDISNLRMESISLMSNTQRYKMLGNGWTVAVIKHFYQYLRV